MQIFPCMNNSLDVSFIFLWIMYLCALLKILVVAKRSSQINCEIKLSLLKLGFTLSFLWLWALIGWLNFLGAILSRHNTEKVVYFLLLDRKLRNPSIEDDHEIRLRSESGNYSALSYQMNFLRLSRDIYFQVYYKYLLK